VANVFQGYDQFPVWFLSHSIRKLNYPLTHSFLFCDSLRRHLHSHSSVITSNIHFLLTSHSSFYQMPTPLLSGYLALSNRTVCDSKQTWGSITEVSRNRDNKFSVVLQAHPTSSTASFVSDNPLQNRNTRVIFHFQFGICC